MLLSHYWLDAVIVAVYLLTLAGVGVHFSRRQWKLEDFFLARRGIAWLPVGLSLMAALNSGIDYLMQPSSIIKFGLVLLVVNLSWLLLYPYVFFVTLPLFRRLRVYTAYEYLEARFDVNVRGLGAAIFMFWRLGWMATALYVPCLAITSVIRRPDLLIPMIVALGGLVTFYTALGGIKAVIWTDVIQFCIMFTGLAATIYIVWCSVPGGWNEIAQAARQVGMPESLPTANGANGIEPLMRWFAIPVTAIGMFITTMVGRIGMYTTDQVMIQRFQTTRSIGAARKGFLITAVSDTVWMIALAFVGVTLSAYFRHFPMPAEVKANPDQIFPYFVGQIFPPGMVGLVVAAILAASLSSIDSAINSMTSVAMIDFVNRLYLRPANGEELSDHDQRRQVSISRVLTVLLGLLGTALSCYVGQFGTIFEIANKIINAFTGPLLGIFLLGMFTRRANGPGVFLGGLFGTAFTLYVVHLANYNLISFIWPSTFGLIMTFCTGYLLSLPFGPSAGKQRWTFRQVLARIDLTE
jgi:solute:Na+ symporter, SSS family